MLVKLNLKFSQSLQSTQHSLNILPSAIELVVGAILMSHFDRGMQFEKVFGTFQIRIGVDCSTTVRRIVFLVVCALWPHGNQCKCCGLVL